MNQEEEFIIIFLKKNISKEIVGFIGYDSEYWLKVAK